MSIQFLVILVPVIFGMMGFAVDLGRLYLVRGELNQAASAMALAAAMKLNSTSAATDTATAAAQTTLDDTLSDGNKYNFGSLLVGQTSNPLLTSSISDPAYFATAADAIQAASQQGTAGTADGTIARHVAISLNADAPLTFWSLLSLGQSRKTSIAAVAVAGVSAPVCTACGIEPFAVAQLSATDTTDFGFVPGTIYTLGMQCNGGPPGLLAGTTQRIPYLIIDRYNTASSFAEDQQLFRIGSQGLLPSTTPALSCAVIGSTENIWATATPQACAAGAPNASVRDAMCGLSARLTDPTQFPTCNLVTNVATIATAYQTDTDLTSLTDYTAYQGDNRRLITLPIVDALSTTVATMTVQGFRQFLLEPTTGLTPASNNPADGDGRFAAMYLGTVAPVKQGRFDGACLITSGPGKVVLHR